MDIPSKIRKIRENLGLTRNDFCETAQISVNTLKGIEINGANPRSDILQKIAECWPKYARWLLIGQNEIWVQFAENALHWIDICEPGEIQQTLIKPSYIKTIELVTSTNRKSFGAIIRIDKPIYRKAEEFAQTMDSHEVSPAILVLPNMGWGTGRETENAETFKKWVGEIDPSMLRDAMIISVQEFFLEKSLSQMRLNTKLISPITQVSYDEELIGKIRDWQRI